MWKNKSLKKQKLALVLKRNNGSAQKQKMATILNNNSGGAKEQNNGNLHISPKTMATTDVALYKQGNKPGRTDMSGSDADDSDEYVVV